jgi:transcription antitermination factor NusG
LTDPIPELHDNSPGELPSPELPPVIQWGALHTFPRAEKVVCEYLRKHTVPHFLPTIKKTRRYQSRVRVSFIPLFPGYVFYDAGAIERTEVFASRRIVGILDAQDQEELRHDLANLALALSKDDALCAARYGEVGKPVQVTRGKFKGLRGEIVRIESATRLLIRVHFIGQAACLAIDESMVEPDL